MTYLLPPGHIIKWNLKKIAEIISLGFFISNQNVWKIDIENKKWII